MRFRTVALTGCVLVTALTAAPNALERSAAEAAANSGGLSLVSARVTIDGTSNIHAYSASTGAVQLTKLRLGGAPSSDILQYVLQPGGLEAFEVSITTASLTSPKEGIDKNMHKALRAQEHPEIRFRLRALDEVAPAATPAPVALRAAGTLTIAGVERDITLDLQVERKGPTLSVTGGIDLLMTDFGITPPKAMLGMLKTSPKVQVRLELVLGSDT